MRITRRLLAAATLALTGLPAHADQATVTGVNTGDAGVIVVTVGDPSTGLLTGQCAFEQVDQPNSDTAALVVAASAATGPRGAMRAVATYLRCRIEDAYARDLVFDREVVTEGGVATDGGVVVTRSSSWSVCVEVRASYAAGIVVTSDGLHCLDPS